MTTAEQEELLQILDDLDGTGHGVTVLRECEKRFGRFVSIGDLYVTLDRLEEAGLVRSTMVEGGEERGFKPKKVWWRA